MASAPTQASPGPGAAQAPNADSDDSSNVTRIFTIQDRLDAIQELRERKSFLGGKLSRPVKQYRKEDVKMHPPRPGMWDDPDQAYYSMFLFLERKYWDGELRAWESLLTRIQRRWERRNDAAGGTVPPPPPVRDMEPLELHTLYLELVHEKVEAGADQGARNPFDGGWHFGDYALLLEHSQAMERLVEEMRKDRGLTNQALTEGEDHSATHESLASASHEDATPQSGPASKKTRTRKPVTAASRKRKKTGGDELKDDTTQQSGPASKKTRKGQSRAPAPKKQNVRGARTMNSTSTSAAKATDIPNELPKATGKRVGNKKAQAKVAPDSEPLTGRIRRGKDNGGPPTGSSRYSRRKAGLKPENYGL